MKTIGYNSARSAASFRVNSEILSKQSISRRLALTPHYAYNPGDVLKGTGYRCRETDWGVRSQLNHNAPLAEHLLDLVKVLDPKREEIRSIQDIKQTRAQLSCVLINDRDTAAAFQIPASVIKWCSELLEIEITPMPRRDSVEQERVNARDHVVANLGASGPDPLNVEPDRAFAYLVATTDPMLVGARDPGNAKADELLPRPSVAAPLLITSDLAEKSAAEEHLQRVLELSRIAGAESLASQFELTCLCSVERVIAIRDKLLPRGGGVIKLEFPLLRQMAKLGATFRINVYPSPAELKRLRAIPQL
jgi:Domain of unknown function (DUF4279)